MVRASDQFDGGEKTTTKDGEGAANQEGPGKEEEKTQGDSEKEGEGVREPAPETEETEVESDLDCIICSRVIVGRVVMAVRMDEFGDSQDWSNASGMLTLNDEDESPFILLHPTCFEELIAHTHRSEERFAAIVLIGDAKDLLIGFGIIPDDGEEES